MCGVQISTRTVNVTNVGETSGCVAQQLNSAALSWCDDRGIRSSVVGRDKIFFFSPKTGSGVHPACYHMIVEGGGGLFSGRLAFGMQTCPVSTSC